MKNVNESTGAGVFIVFGKDVLKVSLVLGSVL